MNYIRNHLSFSILVVIGVVVLAFLIYFLVDTVTNGNTPANNARQVIDKKELPPSQIPEKYPTDIPTEEGAKIKENYNGTGADGRFVANRVFESNKSVDENFMIYQNYLNNNDWKTTATVDQPTYKLLLGTRGTTQLQISISQDAQSQVITVDIALTETSGAPAANSPTPQ